MARYTSVRISVEDKRRLERLAKLMGWSIAETLRRSISLAEKEFLEARRERVEAIVESLRYARDVGETDAESLDEMLYGEP